MPKTREVADLMASKPVMAFRLNKQRFRQVTQEAFDEAFRNGGAIQAEAYASGEPQETMRALLRRARGTASGARQGVTARAGPMHRHRRGIRAAARAARARRPGRPVRALRGRAAQLRRARPDGERAGAVDAQHRACARRRGRADAAQQPARARAAVRDRAGARRMGTDQRRRAAAKISATSSTIRRRS